LASARYPPGPRSGLVRFVQTGWDPLASALSMRRYGDIAHVRLGPQHIYVLHSPELIREVLVTHHRSFRKGKALQGARKLLGDGLLTNEGEAHKRQRRMLQPHFHHERIAGYAKVMVDYAARARGAWRAGQELDVDQEMMRLTLAVTGKTLFDVDLEQDTAFRDALADAVGVFNRIVLPFSDITDRLPSGRKHAEARRRVDERIYGLIEERKRDARGKHDMLSMLLAARDTEGDLQGMSDRQVRDEAVTILLAGHETTANALTWAWYLLSQHPEVERRLHAELDAVLGGGLPSVEDVPRLRYARMVLQESMRLYPPAWILSRQALEDVPLGPYRIPKGSLVVMSQFVVHRDPRWFPDPERFDPERWSPDRGDDGRPRYAYFPFGGGPRTCIGEPFAWMEGVLVIATLAQAWRFRLVPGFPVSPSPKLTLRPKHGMRMVAEPVEGKA
jgi:cytochrome P450